MATVGKMGRTTHNEQVLRDNVEANSSVAGVVSAQSRKDQEVSGVSVAQPLGHF
jgi:hypothetical protein